MPEETPIAANMAEVVIIETVLEPWATSSRRRRRSRAAASISAGALAVRVDQRLRSASLTPASPEHRAEGPAAGGDQDDHAAAHQGGFGGLGQLLEASGRAGGPARAWRWPPRAAGPGWDCPARAVTSSRSKPRRPAWRLVRPAILVTVLAEIRITGSTTGRSETTGRQLVVRQRLRLGLAAVGPHGDVHQPVHHAADQQTHHGRGQPISAPIMIITPRSIPSCRPSPAARAWAAPACG